MGLIDKLRPRRNETASFLHNTTVNKNAPPTFIPDLVRQQAWNKDDNNHLDLVARGDPLASYIVNKLAENTLDDWFKFVDLDGYEIMLDVQKELKLLNAKGALTQTLAAERTFGHSWLYTGKNRYMPESGIGGRIATLQPMTPLDCKVWEYDEVGNPKTLQLEIDVGKGQNQVIKQTINLPAEDFILWNTRPIRRGYKGRSALYSVWDMLTYLRYLYHSMTWYDMKIGHGLFTVYAKDKLGPELKAQMDTAMEDISIKRALVLDDNIEKIEFVGPQSNATDFEEHIDACLKMVAAGTGIPKDILIGATAGAITGSEVNVKALYGTLNQIQTSIEPYIRDLVRRMGYPQTGYEIEWNARYAHNEEEQSKIDMNRAQTLAIRSSWLTINEIREEEGLPPVPEGDKLKAEFNIGITGMPQSSEDEREQTPDERDQTRNSQGEQL